MGHYDSCRGYCRCGLHEDEIPSRARHCFTRFCSKYIAYLRNFEPNHPHLEEVRLRDEREEEERVTKRQIKRRTKEIAEWEKEQWEKSVAQEEKDAYE